MRLISDIAHCFVCSIIILFASTLPACQTKDNAVYDLLALRNEIEAHHSEYSQPEWDEIIGKYDEICMRLDEMPLTKEERMEVEKIKGEIVGYTSKIIIRDAAGKVKDIIDEIVSFTEGFLETF